MCNNVAAVYVRVSASSTVQVDVFLRDLWVNILLGL